MNNAIRVLTIEKNFQRVSSHHSTKLMKQYTRHLDDRHLFIVLRETGKDSMPYVVHQYNALENDFFQGDYCETYERALLSYEG